MDLGRPLQTARDLLLEVVEVDLNIFFPLFGQIIRWEDRLHRTFVDAQTAVDACVRIDVELLRSVVTSSFLHWMNAINRADINARSVLGSNAGFSNHMRHECSFE